MNRIENILGDKYSSFSKVIASVENHDFFGTLIDTEIMEECQKCRNCEDKEAPEGISKPSRDEVIRTNDSYLKIFLRLLRSKHSEALDNDSELVGNPVLQNTPKSIDWRKKGFKTEADNQRTCGSCYAFSIAQSIEGQVFKRTGLILKLSPQQVVDCSTSHGNQGCTGGSLRNTLRYLHDMGGLMLSKDYKYISKKGKCQFVSELAIVNITSWAILQARDEKSIEAAVAHIGPVAISINAKPKTFQLYSDGVYDDDSCAYNSVNHAMLMVGYTRDYWILKNWWGELWGEDGYMRIAKGKNLCGIASYAAYAIV